jgi:hypothetical protein
VGNWLLNRESAINLLLGGGLLAAPLIALAAGEVFFVTLAT